MAYVVDGDTLNCRGGEHVRLFHVDAPEDGPFGDLARRALAALLPVGTTVQIETDGGSRDKQGRLLAYVLLEDGRMVNEMLIRQGYAFLKPTRNSDRHAERLRMAETHARENRLGVWTSP